MNVRLFAVLALTVLTMGLTPGLAVASSTGTQQTYIVLYKSGSPTKSAASLVSRNGGTLVANYSAIGVVIARSSDPAFGSRMRGAAGIEGAASTAGLAVQVEDNTLTAEAAAEIANSADATATDSAEPLWSRQWDMDKINTPEAHAVTTGSPSVVVADLDTGLDFTHPDLAPNYDAVNSTDCSSGTPQPLLPGNDQNGHGTHTAGTIAAAANGIGIVGTAPGVRIAGVKSSNDSGFFFPEMVVCSYMWVASHPAIKVTNNSYYADPWLFNCISDPVQRAIWKAETRAIKYAQSKGVVVVSSTGNNRDDLDHKTQDITSPDYPPGAAVTREIDDSCRTVPVEVPGVIGVSATGPTGYKARYSNYGIDDTDVAAPGGDSRCTFTACSIANPVQFQSLVLSTFPAGLCGGSQLVVDTGASYCYLQGTSMASPHAAGVAALIWSTHPNASAGKVASLIRSSATPTACPTDAAQLAYYATTPSFSNGAPQVCTGDPDLNSFYGNGIIDAYQAITQP